MAAARWGIIEFADEHPMPQPKAACVIGWPVGHSRSPLIHNYWIKQHGLDAEYRREAVAPEQFKDFIAHLAGRGYVGANVTVPHKEVALAVSEPDDRARAVGAANTLWLDGGRLRSTNTDVEGFIGNLDATAPGWDRGLQSALVLGAGGAARAVVFGLLERGIGRIVLVNRTAERAAALRMQFGDRVMLARWSDLDGLMAEAGLLVNTTSLHGRPTVLGDRPCAATGRCGRKRPRLCAARDRPACRRKVARASRRRRPWYAVASGGRRVPALVRRAATGHGGLARTDRG